MRGAVREGVCERGTAGPASSATTSLAVPCSTPRRGKGDAVLSRRRRRRACGIAVPFPDKLARHAYTANMHTANAFASCRHLTPPALFPAQFEEQNHPRILWKEEVKRQRPSVAMVTQRGHADAATTPRHCHSRGSGSPLPLWRPAGPVQDNLAAARPGLEPSVFQAAGSASACRAVLRGRGGRGGRRRGHLRLADRQRAARTRWFEARGRLACRAETELQIAGLRPVRIGASRASQARQARPAG